MDVQEAAKAAKHFVAEVFADEEPTNIGLEEIEFDDKSSVWNVTVAFSRPWNSMKTALSSITGEPVAKRAYKIVTIKNADGSLVSIRRGDLVS